MSMTEITSVIRPASFRSDAGTLPGVGRDGRAITAGIVPKIIETVGDLGEKYLDLARERLKRRDTGENRDSYTLRRRRPTDGAIPGTDTGFTFAEGLEETSFQVRRFMPLLILGGVIVLGFMAFRSK